jgi:putative tricarboxylic transport membrane protein
MERSLIPILFWILLSLFIVFFSRNIGLGEFRAPGPGLMPFLVGLFLLLISLYALIRSLLRRSGREETSNREGSKIHFRQIGLVLLLLLAYALLLEKIGYLITAFLMLVFLFRSAGSKGWRFVLITSSVTALVTYVFFTYLGLRFPTGILGIGGLFK